MSETAILPPELDFPPVGAGDLYEVVNGQVVEPPPMAAFELGFANALSRAIDRHFMETGHLGLTFVEMIFRIQTVPNLQRRPDMAFVSYERWTRDRPIPFTAAWKVVPDLAVEVISPHDTAFEILEKLDDYFRAGVRQVWVIYPRHRRVFVHTSPKSVTVLDATDTLDGGDVLPGFRINLADLFGKTAEAESEDES